MSDFVVYGAGGHAKVVGDALLVGGHHILAFVQDDPLEPAAAKLLLGAPVHRATWLFEARHEVSIGLGVGDNIAREVVYERCREAGFALPVIVHPAAVVARSARLGAGSFLAAGAIVNAGASLGNGVIVNTGAIVEHDVTAGDFVHICPRACVAGGVQIGRLSQIGVGATVLDDRVIGSGTLIGGGAVVVRNVPDAVVAYGVPAVARRGIER